MLRIVYVMSVKRKRNVTHLERRLTDTWGGEENAWKGEKDEILGARGLPKYRPGDQFPSSALATSQPMFNTDSLATPAPAVILGTFQRIPRLLQTAVPAIPYSWMGDLGSEVLSAVLRADIPHGRI
jgi:hypothetical protein